MKEIKNGIFKENPTFVLMLGMCPALAVTNKVESAYIMGLCVLVILLFSNTVISLLKNLIPDSVKTPCYILIIGTFVTLMEMILKAYAPKLSTLLGIYLPLIVVNCIVLGRALAVASKSSVKDSLKDAIGIGLGFTLSLILIAFIREILGSGTITLMDGLSSLTGYRAIYTLPHTELFPISIFKEPAGAFLTLGLLLAIFKAWKGREKHESH